MTKHEGYIHQPFIHRLHLSVCFFSTKSVKWYAVHHVLIYELGVSNDFTYI